jgi:coproporphyrinogen III oxidase
MVFPHPKRLELISFLQSLREEIIQAFEFLEEKKKFERKKWNYHAEGGGEIALLRGEIFEKAAVNWSGVGGPAFPMQDSQGPFFATGISLITHLSNPHAPTVHFNIRFIETQEQYWFGGGYDLTPMGFYYEEDKIHFHSIAKQTLDPFSEDLYQTFSDQARHYFYIPHRKKERGVGGLFFDHFNTGNFDQDRKIWESVGKSFLKAILPIYNRRLSQPYTPEDREVQLQARAHYAEFNLVYDRGTQFGFKSDGNIEAILCSMPPLVKW